MVSLCCVQRGRGRGICPYIVIISSDLDEFQWMFQCGTKNVDFCSSVESWHPSVRVKRQSQDRKDTVRITRKSKFI